MSGEFLGYERHEGRWLWPVWMNRGLLNRPRIQFWFENRGPMGTLESSGLSLVSSMPKLRPSDVMEMLDPIPSTSRQRSHPAIAFKACHGGAQRPTLGARCGSNGDPFEMAIENGTDEYRKIWKTEVWPWDGNGPWGSEMFRANFHLFLPQIPSVQEDLVRWCELMIVGKMNCHLGDHLTLQHAVMQWEQYQPLLVMVPVVLPLLSLPQNVDDETIHKDAQSRQKMQHSFWYRITGICMPLPSTTSVITPCAR